MPKISVIVPVYNVQDYLDQCVESILSQTFSDFELILVDDGSKDNSSAICDAFAKKDPRIVVLHQENTGVSSVRNHGLSVAKSDWVTFIDSDDWVENTYLENFRMDEDDADLYIQGLQFVNNNTHQVTEEKNLPDLHIDENDFCEQVPKYNILALGFPVCKRYRKSIIDTFGIKFNESISHHEDHIFVFEYLTHVRSIVLSSGMKYNYRYFHNPNSLSSRHNDVCSMKVASDLMIDYFSKLLDQYGMSDRDYEKKVGTLCVKPVISALISSYSHNRPQGHNLLIQYLPSVKVLKRFYYPLDNLGKLIKFLAERNKIAILHLCLCYYSLLKK